MYDELVKRLRCMKYGSCPDCPMWYSEEVEQNLWRERCAAIDAADAIEELSVVVRAQKAVLDKFPKWIPVSERLPNYGETVLAYGSRGGIYTARFERARTKWDRDNWWKLNSKSHVCSPTHWMPLPEPPKEEGE